MLLTGHRCACMTGTRCEGPCGAVSLLLPALPRRVTGKAKAAKAAADARQDATLALSQALPRLLRKFSTDDTQVRASRCDLSHPCMGLLCAGAGSLLSGLHFCLPTHRA